ncbi:MAG TPA: glycoside hydrolase family 3 N-terminal domain-containing protein, partial [Steroidobacteraceae bacterium]|nr:glycoside hydrolase family 3 N-terminal domain-containing protein [Steroidobacteraceae bacterium]
MLALAVASLTSSPLAEAQANAGKAVYRDVSAPLERRVEDLLSRMTLDEKIAQITTVWTAKSELLTDQREFDPAKARKLYPAGIGHFARPQDLRSTSKPGELLRDVKQTVDLVNAIQRYQQKDTRLGIPTLFHEESLHGYAARGATSFPQAIALASTWEPELLTRVFTVAAREVRARGAQLVLAPVVDVARDPRWGRIEETFGEDTYLVGRMGVAAIRGFQGRRAADAPIDAAHVAATVKHFTGHGTPEGGRNTGPG